MVFFEGCLVARTANLRESSWMRQAGRLYLIESLCENETIDEPRTGPTRDPSRAHKGPLRKMGRRF